MQLSTAVISNSVHIPYCSLLTDISFNLMIIICGLFTVMRVLVSMSNLLCAFGAEMYGDIPVQ